MIYMSEIRRGYFIKLKFRARISHSAWFLIPVVSLVAMAASPIPAFAQSQQGDECSHPANPIVAENCRPGDPGWKVDTPSYDIMGFTSTFSVNAGQIIQFYVTSQADHFDLVIYRLGYYQGNGGRLVKRIPGIPGMLQPPCLEDISTGLRSCSNWPVSYTLKIPDDWISGVYLARLVMPDDRQNFVPFVVRKDGDRADILYQQSVTTSHAYNNYGGKSLYSHNSSLCLTVSEAPRAVKVSFDRPYNAPMDDPSSFFRAEYPMVRWLESQGYWVTYSTDIDTHHSGTPGQVNALLQHRIFLSVGHDEYWSEEMRSAVTAARDGGVNLGFFSANTSYWKIRLEPDPWTKKPDRVMVAYKTTESGPADPSDIPTGTWRDPAGANQPENALLGVEYIGDNDTLFFPLRVPAEMANDRIYRNTGLQNMQPGTYVDIGWQLVGWEWDAVVNNGYTPAGITVLAASPVTGEILDDAGRNSRPGKAYATTTRYTAPGGAIVFASGTIQWSWGLDVYEPDRRIQQITYNLFSDMGVQPATPASGLVLDYQGKKLPALPRPASQPANTGDLPVLSEPLVETTASSADITWNTSTPTIGQAWLLSLDGQLNASLRFENGAAIDREYQAQHHIVFDQLVPGTEYRYQIISTDPAGRSTISAVFIFQTKPGSITGQARRELEPLKTGIQCVVKPVGRIARYWLQTNLAIVVLPLGMLLPLTGLLVWNVVRGRRKRPA